MNTSRKSFAEWQTTYELYLWRKHKFTDFFQARAYEMAEKRGSQKSVQNDIGFRFICITAIYWLRFVGIRKVHFSCINSRPNRFFHPLHWFFWDVYQVCLHRVQILCSLRSIWSILIHFVQCFFIITRMRSFHKRKTFLHELWLRISDCTIGVPIALKRKMLKKRSLYSVQNCFFFFE